VEPVSQDRAGGRDVDDDRVDTRLVDEARGGEAGALEGMRGTTPLPESVPDEFRSRVEEVDPEVDDINYAAESYDAVITITLAAQIADSDGVELASEINGVTKDGEKCTSYTDCLELVEAGTDIDYDGVSGPMEFAGNGEPTMHPRFAVVVDRVLAARDALAPATRVAILTNGLAAGKPEIAAALRRVDARMIKLDPGPVESANGVRYDRQRIVAAGPWPRASLFPGVSGTLTWHRGSQPVSTSGPACLLTLVRHTRVQPVTGLWRHGRVSRWSFGGRLTTSRAPGRTNVRVLPDGRVTKVYLR